MTKEKIALEVCYITAINREFEEERANPRYRPQKNHLSFIWVTDYKLSVEDEKYGLFTL